MQRRVPPQAEEFRTGQRIHARGPLGVRTASPRRLGQTGVAESGSQGVRGHSLPTVLLEFVVQGNTINVENFGSEGLVAFAIFENRKDVRAFDVFQSTRQMFGKGQTESK